jgi:hypothetical protein
MLWTSLNHIKCFPSQCLAALPLKEQILYKTVQNNLGQYKQHACAPVTVTKTFR